MTATEQMGRPPTKREALNIARNALHTLVFYPEIGGSALESLGERAREKGSDQRYALSLLDDMLSAWGHEDGAVLPAIVSEPATLAPYYAGGL